MSAAPRPSASSPNPAEALRLLCQHQDHDWDGSAEPDDLDQKPAEDDIDHDQPAADEEADVAAEPDRSSNTGLVEDQPLESDPASDKATHRSLHITTPPPFDPKRARPRAIVYLHLSEAALTAASGVARVEDVGPVLLSRLPMLLGDNCTISLKPVIDLPAGHMPVDAYEISASLREQLLLRYPADSFPYADSVSRAIDMDHTIRYLSLEKGGPPGQTRIGNLGPHIRYHHRIKTFGGCQVRQPEPSSWIWRSPHGRIYLVNATGTHPLGDTDFAQAIWYAVTNAPQKLQSDPDMAGT